MLNKHKVYIASSGGELLEEFLRRDFVFVRLPIRTKKEISPKIVISAIKLYNFMKKEKIEIVHSSSRTTQVLSCLLSSLLGLPHISTCHGFFKKRFFRMLLPCWGRKIIAISESVRQHLIEDFKIDNKRIVVVHSGIDVSKFKVEGSGLKEEYKKKLGLEGSFVVSIVARLSDVKGHVYLIEATAEALKKIRDIKLLIVGDGKMKHTLMNLVERLNINNNVVFIPGISDTRDVMFATDIFVMPSLKEGLGLSLMEAMASGVAVIGSNVGGIKSLIQDGITGILVEPKDTRGLSEAILNLLSNPEKKVSLGRQAQEFINANFSLDKMVLQTERVYLECLKEKS